MEVYKKKNKASRKKTNRVNQDNGFDENGSDLIDSDLTEEDIDEQRRSEDFGNSREEYESSDDDIYVEELCYSTEEDSDEQRRGKYSSHSGEVYEDRAKKNHTSRKTVKHTRKARAQEIKGVDSPSRSGHNIKNPKSSRSNSRSDSSRVSKNKDRSAVRSSHRNVRGVRRSKSNDSGIEPPSFVRNMRAVHRSKSTQSSAGGSKSVSFDKMSPSCETNDLDNEAPAHNNMLTKVYGNKAHSFNNPQEINPEYRKKRNRKTAPRRCKSLPNDAEISGKVQQKKQYKFKKEGTSIQTRRNLAPSKIQTNITHREGKGDHTTISKNTDQIIPQIFSDHARSHMHMPENVQNLVILENKSQEDLAPGKKSHQGSDLDDTANKEIPNPIENYRRHARARNDAGNTQILQNLVTSQSLTPKIQNKNKIKGKNLVRSMSLEDNLNRDQDVLAKIFDQDELEKYINKNSETQKLEPSEQKLQSSLWSLRNKLLKMTNVSSTTKSHTLKQGGNTAKDDSSSNKNKKKKKNLRRSISLGDDYGSSQNIFANLTQQKKVEDANVLRVTNQHFNSIQNSSKIPKNKQKEKHLARSASLEDDLPRDQQPRDQDVLAKIFDQDELEKYIDNQKIQPSTPEQKSKQSFAPWSLPKKLLKMTNVSSTAKSHTLKQGVDMVKDDSHTNESPQEIKKKKKHLGRSLSLEDNYSIGQRKFIQDNLKLPKDRQKRSVSLEVDLNRDQDVIENMNNNYAKQKPSITEEKSQPPVTPWSLRNKLFKMTNASSTTKSHTSKHGVDKANVDSDTNQNPQEIKKKVKHLGRSLSLEDNYISGRNMLARNSAHQNKAEDGRPKYRKKSESRDTTSSRASNQTTSRRSVAPARSDLDKIQPTSNSVTPSSHKERNNNIHKSDSGDIASKKASSSTRSRKGSTRARHDSENREKTPQRQRRSSAQKKNLPRKTRDLDVV